jgi:type IX secretion system PorP/SprF family membrane protein
MMVRIKRHIAFLLFFAVSQLQAQQEPLYTQFGFNKLSLNPAYAGNEDYTSFTGIYRDQWNGFPGAPDAQLLSVDLPRINESLGLGFFFQRQSLGISRSLSFTGNYSYKVRTEDFTVSFGLSTVFRNLSLDFTDPRLVATDGLEGDGAITLERLNKNLLNVGFGTYVFNEKYFAGISIPGLVKNDLELGDDNDEVASQSFRHLFIMGGAALPINELLTFKPQFLLRWAENAPASFDLNAGILYQEKYNAALTYRTGGGDGDLGESIDIMLGVQITDQLMIGIAQDFTLSSLRQYDQGSIEILLHYRAIGSGPKKKIANPRFF